MFPRVGDIGNELLNGIPKESHVLDRPVCQHWWEPADEMGTERFNGGISHELG